MGSDFNESSNLENVFIFYFIRISALVASNLGPPKTVYAILLECDLKLLEYNIFKKEKKKMYGEITNEPTVKRM